VSDLLIDSKSWEGVQSLLDNYARVEAGDQVVLLYTSDSFESAAWVAAALEIRGVKTDRVWMAPLHDENFPQRLASALPDPNSLRRHLVVLSFERDTMSHTTALMTALASYEKSEYTVIRAISSCSGLFSDALHAHPMDLSSRNTALLQRFMRAAQLRITTPSGSDLTVALDRKHRWISNRGVSRPGGVVIIPAGEVATFPATIDGVFVADFAFNVNAITDRDARLQEHPVTVEVAGGRAIKHACEDDATSRFLEECFETYCAYNVGELGFGTNFAVDGAIPMNSHINERRPGVHLGFGQHNQDPRVVGYQCAIHLDLIARGGTVWVDEDPVPLDLEQLVPSLYSHPISPRDEDVFSPGTEELEVDDCCGILTGDGLQLFSPPPA
jgi:leucyl aminopeptidase (aminopeptidase T)